MLCKIKSFYFACSFSFPVDIIIKPKMMITVPIIIFSVIHSENNNFPQNIPHIIVIVLFAIARNRGIFFRICCQMKAYNKSNAKIEKTSAKKLKERNCVLDTYFPNTA